MYLSNDDNEFGFYEELYYNVLNKYGIYIKNEYKFVYDEFLEHLISDTISYVKKNYKSNLNNNPVPYKINVFKRIFSTHLSSNVWYTKIYYPEQCPEIIKKVRNNKLEKIKTLFSEAEMRSIIQRDIIERRRLRD